MPGSITREGISPNPPNRVLKENNNNHGYRIHLNGVEIMDVLDFSITVGEMMTATITVMVDEYQEN